MTGAGAYPERLPSDSRGAAKQEAGQRLDTLLVEKFPAFVIGFMAMVLIASGRVFQVSG